MGKLTLNYIKTQCSCSLEVPLFDNLVTFFVGIFVTQDEWKTTLLLRVKLLLKAKEEEDDDDLT